MKFAAVGDGLIQRRLPPNYEGFQDVVNWIGEAETRFMNLETTIHRPSDNCFGNQDSGGSYLRTDPEALDDVHRFGFNMVTPCNNHAMDWSHRGLVKTLEYLDASGLVHAGTGRNLDEAAAPAYLDTEKGRVALIAASTSGGDTWMAGRQSRRVPGRPGINKVRLKVNMIVTQEQMDQLKIIAEQIKINGLDDIHRKEGYVPPVPEGCFAFGLGITFKVGDKPGREGYCVKADLERMAKSIYDAKFQSDYIIVSIHCHETSGTNKSEPAMAQEQLARFCIDNGADAVVGHGPHLLRPMEINKGKPIFYSLGDFIMQNENSAFTPEDMFTKYGLTSDASMYELYRTRSADFTRGLMVQPVMFESVIPRWEVDESGKLTKLELLAIELGFEKPRSRSGLPAPAKDDSILRRFAEMSAPYGVKMEIHGNKATVILD